MQLWKTQNPYIMFVLSLIRKNYSILVNLKLIQVIMEGKSLLGQVRTCLNLPQCSCFNLHQTLFCKMMRNNYCLKAA